MKRLAITSALTLVLGLTAATAAQAQFEETDGVPPPVFRKGWWGFAGGGWGSQGCSLCSGRLNGITVTAGAGGTLSPQFLAGATVNGWTTESDNGTRLAVGAIDARFIVYPTAWANWHLSVGAGVSAVSEGVYPDVNFPDAEWGTSFMVGTGFDLRLSRTFSLTPYIAIMGVKTENLDANVAHAGLVISFH